MTFTRIRNLAAIVAVAASLDAMCGHAALVAHYRFDDEFGNTALDSATADGSQDAFRNQGTIGWSQFDEGLIGGALNLPGGASLQAPDALTSGATAFTISVWFNPRSEAPAYDGIYVARNENWGVAYEGGSAADVHIDFRIDNDPGAGSTGFDSPLGSITINTWHHVALTWTSDGSFASSAAYLNGQLVNSVNSNTNPDMAKIYTGHLSTWNIGDDPCCGGREIDAQIDDLAVFNTALSSTEILQIYNWGLEGKDATGLAAPLPRVPGDVDGNRTVDMADFEIIRANFYNSATLREEGDLNRDGVVDFADFDQWKTAFQAGLPAATSIPEPGALVAVLTAFVGTLVHRGGTRRALLCGSA
jgi:hypothetical protein